MLIFSQNSLINHSENKSLEKQWILLNNGIIFKSQDYIDLDFYVEVIGDLNDHIYLTYSRTYSLIYWLNPLTKSIMMKTFNGSSHYHIKNVTSTSGDLLINHDINKIVWSDIGKHPAIHQMNFDGTQEIVIYSKTRAFHLTIDQQAQLYYFVDFTTYSLYSIDYHGDNQKLYVKNYNKFYREFGIAIWNNDLYIADHYNIYKITEVNFKIDQGRQILKSTDLNITYFEQVVFYTDQSNIQNNCEQADCSQLCVPIGQCMLSWK